MRKMTAAGLCGYEVLAITSGRIPTLSALCRTRPWLRAALVASLAIHLYSGQAN